jgi:hypothetical protein
MDPRAPLEIRNEEINSTKEGLKNLNTLSKIFLKVLQDEYESVQNIF